MINNSFKNGYEIYKIEDLALLNKVRNKIYLKFRKIFDLKEKNPEIGFNNFHKLINKQSKKKINEKRLKLIAEINNISNLGELIFNLFSKEIINLFGSDILIQKNINLVIQMPNDPNPSEIHRDAPLNSSYEIVLWLPLVNCFNSKAMYLLDYESTKKSIKFLKDNKSNWIKFEKKSKKISKNPPVNFGEALLFHSGLLHGSDINKEKETRISLNLRFKNLFSPSGLKNQLQYYRPINISNITKIGAKIDSEEIF